MSRPTRHTSPFWAALALGLVLIVLDQWLKAWAVAHLNLGAPAIPVVPGVLDWQLTYNTGAAWSMFSGSTKLLAVLRLVVALLILGYLWRKPQSHFLTLIFTLIAAGAAGNAIDGLTNPRGVVDMIHSPALSAVTRAINGTYFPIFNIADMCVVGGTLLLLAASFWPEKKAEAQALPEGASHDEQHMSSK